MKNELFLFSSCLAVLLLASCTFAAPEPTPTATFTPSPTDTPVPTATQTETITATLTATVTPTPTQLPAIPERQAWEMSKPYFCASTDAEAKALISYSFDEMAEYFGWPLGGAGLVTAYRAPWDDQVCFIILKVENGQEVAFIIPDGNGGYLVYPRIR